MRELYPILQPTTNPHKSTHFNPDTGDVLRQKTDTYPFVNIFIEEFSDYRKHTIGGPFQAFDDGCNMFCYYYPLEGKIIWTTLSKESIQSHYDLLQMYRGNNHRTKYVPNKGYLTKGYTINVWEYLKWMGNFCTLTEVPVRPLE